MNQATKHRRRLLVLLGLMLVGWTGWLGWQAIRPPSPHYWSAMLSRAKAAQGKHQYRRAAYCMHKAVREAERFGPTDVRLAKTLAKQGDLWIEAWEVCGRYSVFLSDRTPEGVVKYLFARLEQISAERHSPSQVNTVYRRSLSIYEQAHTSNLSDLGYVYINFLHRYKHTDSENDLFYITNQIIELKDKITGANKVKKQQELIPIYITVSSYFRQLGNNSDALLMAKCALELREKLAGDDTSELIRVYKAFLDVFEQIGNREEILHMAKRIFALQEQLYGANSIKLLPYLYELENIYIEYDRAAILSCRIRQYTIMRGAYTKRDERTAEAFRVACWSAISSGQYETAIHLAKERISDLSSTKRDDSQWIVALTLHAHALAIDGRLTEAEAAFQRVINTYAPAFPQHFYRSASSNDTPWEIYEFYNQYYEFLLQTEHKALARRVLLFITHGTGVFGDPGIP